MKKLRTSILISCMLGSLASCTSQHSWTARLTDDDPAERIRAIRHFTDVGDTKLAPQLVACLEDEDVAVRFYAIMGLERLTGKRFGYAYYGSNHDRAVAIRSWQQYLIEIGATSNSAKNESPSLNNKAAENRPVTQAQERGRERKWMI